MQTKNLADLYDLDAIPWSKVQEALTTADPKTQRCFLATSRPDGQPHLAGVGAIWDDGTVYFVSGPDTRKSRNLVANPACAVSMALTDMDLVFEGRAERVTEERRLQHIARLYADLGWPATVEDGAFTYEYSAPSAGPPPWFVYALRPETVFGVMSAEPGGATRWTFDD